MWSGIGDRLEVASARFYRCPIAVINEGATHDLMSIHRRLSIQGVRLSDVVERPTSACLDGLAVIAAEVSAVHADQRKRAKRDADIKAKAKAGRK